MRRPSSIGGQLRTGLVILAALLASAAAFVYVGVGRQDAAFRQLNNRFYVLQHLTGQLDASFVDSQLAVGSYGNTGEKRFLLVDQDVRANYNAQLALMLYYAPHSMRGLIDRQSRAGAAWFAIADQIIRHPDDIAAARRQTDGAWATNQQFSAANSAMLGRINDSVRRLIRDGNRVLGIGLAWSVAVLSIAALLALAVGLSTVRRTTRPLQNLRTTLRTLTAGQHQARARVSGAAEIQDVALAVNALADESDRLRGQEAASRRLRAMARETGFRIREHLRASDVIMEARIAIEADLDADVVYLHVIRDGEMGPPEGHEHDWLLGDTFLDGLPPGAIRELEELFRNQHSQVIQDVPGPEGDQLPPGVAEPLRQAGIVSHLLTPFGVGSELLGIIAAERLRAGHPWTTAEIDAVESIAADLGRGLHHARLYEAENRLVEELKAVDRAKDEFLGTVSHELRTPLTSITGYVEMLEDEHPGPLTAEQSRMIATIDRNATRLRNLIEDLLTLSKIESGAFRTVLQPVNLGEIISLAVAEFEPIAARADVTLRSAGAAAVIVDGDAHQLDRVIANLLSNAVKFTPAGGQITVTLAADGDSAVISVADTGIGIPEKDKTSLVTRFFRASNATERAIPGTGLGLTIVRTIVDNHGGAMVIESQERRGTTISVRLPLSVEAAVPLGST